MSETENLGQKFGVSVGDWPAAVLVLLVLFLFDSSTFRALCRKASLFLRIKNHAISPEFYKMV